MWPRHFLIVDAATRLVTRIVHAELGLHEAQVQVREGGPRGMTVTVRLPPPQRDSLERIRDALRPFLFEVEVSAGVSSGGLGHRPNSD